MQQFLPLSYYIHKFSTLNYNKHRGRMAPHKPVMLLAVMEGIEYGWLTNGFVPHNERMVAAFRRCWTECVDAEWHYSPKFEYPFTHMEWEGVWHLMRTPQYVPRKEYSLSALRQCFYGAKVDDALWAYREEPASRSRLRRALLEAYFPERGGLHGTAVVAECDADYGDSGVGTGKAFEMAA